MLRPHVRQRLDALAARTAELLAQSADPRLLERPDRLAALQKELGQATPIVERYRELQRLEQQQTEHRALVDGTDRDLAELARAELPQLEQAVAACAETLVDLLLDEQGDDRRDCIVEIRAGTGGEEAALFARDLGTIYQRFAARMGWAFEPMAATPAEQGGFKEIVFALRGQAVFRAMQFESGGHRVQRVPETEQKGRVHTSAATVAVLPEAEEVEVRIDDKDLKVDTFRSSGAGGQHVNKTESAVRITHIPTGIVVVSAEKSQHQNRRLAMQVLRSRIFEVERERAASERSEARKAQVGSGDRSQRIRTYNFPQGRVTDHRINLTLHKLDSVLAGDGLDELIDALTTDHQASLLAEMEGQGSA